VELHPNAAARVASPPGLGRDRNAGRTRRARAHLNDSLDPRRCRREHGWWQDCAELGAPGYDRSGRIGANFNLTVDPTMRDPVSGTTSHRPICARCDGRRWTELPTAEADGRGQGTRRGRPGLPS